MGVQRRERGGGEAGRNHSPPRSARRAGRAPPARKRGPASRRWHAAPALWARARRAPLAAKAARREAGVAAPGGAGPVTLFIPFPMAAARSGARGAAAGAVRACAAGGEERAPAHRGLGSRPPGRSDRCAAACPPPPDSPAARQRRQRPWGKGFATSPHRPPVSWAPVAPGPRTCGHDSWRLGQGKGSCVPGTVVGGDGDKAPGSEPSGRTAPRRPGLGPGAGGSAEAGPGRTRAAAAAAAVRVLSLGGAGGRAGAALPGGECHGGSPGIPVTKTPAGLSPGRLGACYQQSPPSLDCLGESGANQSFGLGSSPVWVF